MTTRSLLALRADAALHTSSVGINDHNQTLSTHRAGAVLDYLVAHGIAKEPLASKGFASTVPIDTNATAAGQTIDASSSSSTSSS